MKSKLCIVTGANAGIGKEVAKGLVRQGSDLIIVCRNQSRAQAARAEILGSVQSGPLPTVDIELADFSDLDSVSQLCERLTARERRVDVLINNAGAFFNERQLTTQGWEKTFVTNHLGPMLLTEHVVASSLQAAGVGSVAPFRVVNVASEAHRQVRRRTEDWNGEESFVGFKAYGLSKLCNILYTKDLARRFKESELLAFSLHPGVIATDIGTKGGGVLGWLWKMSKPFMATVEKGAETPIFLATQSDVGAPSGSYFARCRAQQPTKLACDDDYREALMAKSWAMLGPWLKD